MGSVLGQVELGRRSVDAGSKRLHLGQRALGGRLVLDGFGHRSQAATQLLLLASQSTGPAEHELVAR